jgi:hypothetical protein
MQNAEGKMQNSRSVKSVKIFTRRDAEAQRKSCRAFLLGLSLHRYIERSRIFGKILPSLFSPFAVQVVGLRRQPRHGFAPLRYHALASSEKSPDSESG